jgi:hypothetical protein
MNVLPSQRDILCGKTSTNKHPGNVFFRQLILAKVDDYMLSTKKAQKGSITADVLDELDQNGSRFMKLDEKTKKWTVISTTQAREKVSHAIRDRVRERKKGKIVLPTSPQLPSTPIAKATLNRGGSKTTRIDYAHTVKPNMTTSKTTRSVNVAHEGDSIVTSTSRLLESIRLVSEGEEENCSCSCHDSTLTSLAAFPLKCAHGCFIDSYDSVAPSPILSYYEGTGACHFMLPHALDRGLSSTFDDVAYSVSVASEDDASFYLDNYNDLTLNELWSDSDNDGAHRIISMLQDACSIGFEQ